MCQGITLKGTQCSFKGEPFCKKHSPKPLQKQQGELIPYSLLDKTKYSTFILKRGDGGDNFAVLSEDRYNSFNDESIILKRMFGEDTKGDEKEIERLKAVNKHTANVLEKARSEAKMKYKNMSKLYNETINQVVSLKKKLKEANGYNNELEQKVKALKKSTNINQCLNQYQTLDNFIDESIFMQTGRRRNAYNSNSIYDFVRLSNVEQLLQPFGVDADEFKDKYLQIRHDRIAVAHPNCGVSNKSVLNVLNNITIHSH